MWVFRLMQCTENNPSNNWWFNQEVHRTNHEFCLNLHSIGQRPTLSPSEVTYCVDGISNSHSQIQNTQQCVHIQFVCCCFADSFWTTLQIMKCLLFRACRRVSHNELLWMGQLLTTFPQCIISLEFPGILSQNHIYYHWLSAWDFQNNGLWDTH